MKIVTLILIVNLCFSCALFSVNKKINNNFEGRFIYNSRIGSPIHSKQYEIICLKIKDNFTLVIRGEKSSMQTTLANEKELWFIYPLEDHVWYWSEKRGLYVFNQYTGSQEVKDNIPLLVKERIKIFNSRPYLSTFFKNNYRNFYWYLSQGTFTVHTLLSNYRSFNIPKFNLEEGNIAIYKRVNSIWEPYLIPKKISIVKNESTTQFGYHIKELSRFISDDYRVFYYPFDNKVCLELLRFY